MHGCSLDLPCSRCGHPIQVLYTCHGGYSLDRKWENASNVGSSTGDLRPLAHWMVIFSIGEFLSLCAVSQGVTVEGPFKSGPESFLFVDMTVNANTKIVKGRSSVRRATRPQVLYRQHHLHERFRDRWCLYVHFFWLTGFMWSLPCHQEDSGLQE